VIGLGPNLFYGTGIPACLMILRHNQTSERQQHVRIIDGSQRYQTGRTQNRLNDDDVTALLDAYGDPDAEIDQIKQVTVTIDEIAENDWDLNLGRYIEQDAAETIDVTSALQAMNDAEAATAAAQAAMHERLKAAGYA
jgi:type I restriction enzyme M protein